MLRDILIVILCLYVFSFILRKWIAPWMLRRFMRRMAERMNPGGQQQHTRQGDTDIHIPRKHKSKSNRTYSSAEYVDFEDVKDGN